MESKVVRSQYTTKKTTFRDEQNVLHRIKVTIRFDDRCGNGHNTFSITAGIDRFERNRWREDRGGCCHEEITKYMPEIAPLIKWHLCSTDGPMHYVANTLYHLSEVPAFQGQYYFKLENKIIRIVDENEKAAMTTKYGEHAVFEQVLDFPSKRKPSDLEAARSTAFWPDAQPEDITRENLEARLPALLTEFKEVVESLGFTW